MKSLKKHLFFLTNLILILFITVSSYSCSNETSREPEKAKSKVETNHENESRPAEKSKSFFSLSTPFHVYGSKYSLMRISMSDERYQTELQQRAGYLPENIINILFYDLSNSDYKLLFSIPVNITGLDYPANEKEKEQKYILYKAVINDSNNDKKLDDKDNIVLYVSDPDGNNLTRITDSKFNLVDYSKLGQNRLLIIISIPDKNIPKDNWPNKAIVYDVSTNKIINNEFDLMLEKAEKIFNSFN